jgi:GH25 family lysozyme M1 (1,4-beta-N-acetylmuramidase)
VEGGALTENSFIYIYIKAIITFNSFTERILCRYLFYHSVGVYFTDGFVDKIRLLEKTSSVIFGVSARLKVKKKLRWFYRRTMRAKKNLSAEIYRHNYFIGDWQWHLE